MKNTCLSSKEIHQEFIKINKSFCRLVLWKISDRKGEAESSHRTLCLLATDNSAESICLYCYFIKEKIPFLLVDASTSKERLQQIIHSFQPAYLFVPEGEGDFLPSSDYGRKEVYGQYVCWRFTKESVWQSHRVAPEVAVLLSTSGSTGSSKFVVLTYENLESNADSIIQSLGMKQGERTAVMLPISYSYGLSVVNSTLKASGTLLIPDGMMMEKSYWDFLEKERVNIIYGVPYTYEVFQKRKLWRRPWEDLRLITQAGGALSYEMKKALLEEVGQRRGKGQNIDLAIMYGQTEATARMSCFFLNYYPEKIHSVGRAIPGGRFSIAEPDGESRGEILYEGRNVSLGYALSWRDLTEDIQCQKQDSGKSDGERKVSIDSIEKDSVGTGRLLHTGDIGWLDDDGFLYITGRKSRFMKVQGYRFSLDELQEELEEEIQRGFIAESPDELQDNGQFRMTLKVVCVNGFNEGKEWLGVVVERTASQKVQGNKECKDQAIDKMIWKNVNVYFQKNHFKKNDYGLVIIEEIPRRSNGKIDYQKLEKLFKQR